MSFPFCAGLLAEGFLVRRSCESGRETTIRWSEMDRDEGLIVCESIHVRRTIGSSKEGDTTGCGKTVSNCLAL
jgi:hypothetical protein